MRYLIRYSGGHSHLALLEIAELLKPHTFKEVKPLLLQVDCEEDKINFLIQKSGSVRHVFRLLSYTKEGPSSLLAKALELNFEFINGRSFRVRAYRITKEDIDIMDLERKLGNVIWQKTENVSVVMKNPEVEVGALIWNTGGAICQHVASKKASEIDMRAPKTFMFSRGGAIKQQIARLMVNMRVMDEGEYAIDPFCGHGGLLYEMTELGYNPIGIELDVKIVRQAKANMKSRNYYDRIHLVAGDALRLPFRRGTSSYFITDPPYSIQTTTSGMQVADLAMLWLQSLEKGVFVSMATPNDVLKELPEKWRTIKSAEDYVHSKMTRIMRLITNE